MPTTVILYALSDAVRFRVDKRIDSLEISLIPLASFPGFPLINLSGLAAPIFTHS